MIRQAISPRFAMRIFLNIMVSPPPLRAFHAEMEAG
jgi:hypothetical protein